MLTANESRTDRDERQEPSPGATSGRQNSFDVVARLIALDSPAGVGPHEQFERAPSAVHPLQ